MRNVTHHRAYLPLGGQLTLMLDSTLALSTLLSSGTAS